jgi:large subunit ribosomal protein L21
MYAVIRSGSRQFRVAPGDTIRVDALPGEVGSEVQLSSVLAIVRDSDELVTGSDLGEAAVKATITGHGRGEKVVVFKFKRKKQYKRTIGHRHNYTELRINEINA